VKTRAQETFKVLMKFKLWSGQFRKSNIKRLLKSIPRIALDGGNATPDDVEGEGGEGEGFVDGEVVKGGAHPSRGDPPPAPRLPIEVATVLHIA